MHIKGVEMGMHVKDLEGLIRMGSAHQGCGRVNKDRECTSKVWMG